MATEEMPWTALSDTLLQRAALVARVACQRSPDPFAGLKVDEQDLSDLLRELPGLEPVESDVVAKLEKALAGPIAAARSAFAALLDGDAPLAVLARRADLTLAESEVLGLLCRGGGSIHVGSDWWLSERRCHTQAFDTVDVAPGLLTRRGTRAGSRPRRQPPPAAGLLAPASDAPWAASPLAVMPAVMWWLAGGSAHDTSLPAGVDLLDGTAREAVSASPRPLSSHMIAVAASPDRQRRLEAVKSAFGGLSCLVVATPPQDDAAWDAVIRRATVEGLGVVLDVASGLSAEARDRVDRTTHVPWGITSSVDLPLDDLPRRPWVAIPVGSSWATVEEWNELFGPIEMPPQRLRAEQLRLVGVAARSRGRPACSNATFGRRRNRCFGQPHPAHPYMGRSRPRRGPHRSGAGGGSPLPAP